jgi:hypothetical protein
MIDAIISLIRRPRFLALILSAIFFVTIYAAGQSILRSSANDPQIQIAEDMAESLGGGMPAAAITPGPGKTIEKGIAQFVVIYDKDGNPTAGSATYRGALPKPPQGVFNYAGERGQHRVTWQPEKNLRFAVVIVPYKTSEASGFVMSARSLREVDARIETLGGIALYGWLVSLIVIALTSATGMHHVRKMTGRSKKK